MLTQEQLRYMQSQIVLRRFGTAEDVAHLIYLFAPDRFKLHHPPGNPHG
jgi:hypothetical protein